MRRNDYSPRSRSKVRRATDEQQAIDQPNADDAELTLPEAINTELDEDGAEHSRFVLSRDAKHRLDKFLQNRLKSVSRNQIQKLIALGGVTVNNKTPKASTTLKEGDVIDVILPPRPAKEIIAEDIPLDILYEDDAFIVVNKQADLIVHPARGRLTGTLLNALAYHFQQAGVAAQAQQQEQLRQEGEIAGLSTVGTDDARPGIVHRLDRNTTGVIILAKKDEAHWLLARQFEYRTNLKSYFAVVHGCPDPVGGAIEQPIGKHPTIREGMAVRHDSQSKHALTLYRVRERYKGYSLVELELKTGRTHQIRVHLSYIGHPIVGDILYGGEPVGPAELADPPRATAARPMLTYARPKEDSQKIEQALAGRDDIIMATPALHAALLRIKHPMTEDMMTFTAPVHSPMRELILKLRQQPEDGPVVTEGYHVDMTTAMPE